jgi:hypothetical protein
MAPVDPKAPARAPAPAPKPAPVAEEVEEVSPVPVAEEVEEAAPAPVVEQVNIAGLILEKTVYPDGLCETEVLKEPMIAPELVRATRSLQRARGH